MADIPPEVYEAAAIAMHDVDCYDERCSATVISAAYGTKARAIVDAVVPIIRRHIAAEIIAHADKHAPRDGNQTQRTMRRHLHIAARIATGLPTIAETADALNAQYARTAEGSTEP